MLKVYLLVACICVLIAAILYTFYLNRLVAAVIGLLLRIRYWNQGGSSIWIQIGEILLKDVRYHSSNQTMKIVKAQIAWRYWLRVPATEDDLNRAHVGGEDFNQTHALPSCRIKVSVQGFEWFLYNKTAAYDHIISQMQANAPPPPEASEPRRLFSQTSGLEGLYPPSVLANIKAPPVIHAALNWIKRQMPYLDPKDLLPISIEVFKLAIVCGNPSTPNLMVAECHRADGTFGIVRLLNFKFQNTLVHLVENEDYQGTMPNIGHSIRVQAESSNFADRIPLTYLSFGVFAKMWKGLKLYSTLFNPRQSLSSGHKSRTFIPSKKSRKSLDEDAYVGADFTTLEYAIERRIIEAPMLELSYYADAVGEVPPEASGPKGIGLESYDIGNGDLPPEWGIDLVIRRGVIRYGPWADRQRVHLQRTFFPPAYHDSEVSQRLRPGDKRIWTAMKIFIELREETSLNLPFREASKNWKWDGRADFLRPKIREHASLHVAAGDSSSISYLIPMVIGPDGYESRLEVHLDTVKVTSSLNDIKLIIAESCRVSAALPAPLRWNEERLWSFTVSLRQPTIFLLRDHINMFTDLSRDWTTGPPTEWHHFVPTAGGVTFKMLGWVIRYFMVLRDNYFGSFTHFSTLTEYLEKRNRGEVGDPIEKKWRPEKSNMLQVEISFMVQHGSFLLPSGLPGYEKYTSSMNEVGTSLLLAFPELQLDFRLHDYFMEMSLNVGELRGCILEACSEDVFFRDGYQRFKETLVIDGIDITANRLFGPPPRTRTYVCVWEVALGHVKALLSVLEGRMALAAVDAFRINYTDLANAPASEFSIPLDPDLTLVKLSLKALNATCLAGTAAVDLELPQGLSLHTNDLQGQLCGKLLSLRLPSASLKTLVTSGSSRKSWSEAAAIDFDVNVESYSSPKTKDNPQGTFLHGQDTLTQRAQYLLGQLKQTQEDFRGKHHPSAPRRRPRPTHRVHRNDLYLPPLTLPQFHRVQPSNAQQQPQQQAHPSPGPRWSRLSHLSESDGENIAEADRDARLARSRILRPIAVNHADDDKQSISDDESDNEDLTDTGSSESDCFNFLHDISSREGSPFTPSKSDNLTCSGSMLRLECVHGIEVFVTPLVILVASRLRDEVELRDLSAELTLDAFLVRHLTSFPSLEKQAPSPSPALDILVHSVHVQVAEQIHLKKGNAEPSSSPPDAVLDDQTMDIVLHNALTGLRFRSIPQIREGHSFQSMQVAFDEMSIGLGRLPSPPSGIACDSPRPEFCLSLSTFQASLVQTSLEVSFGNFTVQMGTPDPEYIVALLLSGKNDMQELSSMHRDWRARASHSFPNLVQQILWLTRDDAIVDPLSMIQPSFLVQRGLPHGVRTNGALKFLFHLRLCLRQCGDGLHSSHQASPQEVKRLMELCLANLMIDLDAPDEAHPNPWELLYPAEKPISANSPLPITSINIAVDSLRLTVLSISSKSHSYFTSSSLRVRYQSSALVQVHLASQESLAGHAIKRNIVVFSIADIALMASPRLVDFAQAVVRLRRYRKDSDAVETLDIPATPATHSPSQTVILAHIGSMNLRAGAENLTFEVGGSSLDLCSSVFVRPGIGMNSTSNVFTFGDLHVRARSKKADAGVHVPEQDILASLVFTNGKINATQRQDPGINMLRLVFVLEEILVSVPRSAIRLYRFMEEWKADFLPDVEATAETLVSELKRNSTSTVSKPSITPGTKRPTLTFHVNGCVAMLGVTLQVMRGTWLSWTIGDMTAFISSTPNSNSKRMQTFGLQLGSQGFTITYKSRSIDNSTGVPRVKLILPALTLSGDKGKGSIELLVALDFVNVMVKPTHLDTLLVVQQKFGQDFTDLLELIQETRQKRSAVPKVKRTTATPSRFIGHVDVKGFRLGLEGPSSVFYLECQNVGGDVAQRDGALRWQVQLRGLALSLAPSTGVAAQDQAFDRNKKSAFVIVDITISANDGELKTVIPKIQAVMQPSSIGELGDFIDYHQAELIARRHQRATELEAFREKTRSILKTFEGQSKESGATQKPSWLSEHTIVVEIERIGVAFPLTLDQSLELPQWPRRDLPSVRAFLFSVRRIRFNAQRGEAGRMETKELSFQFVNQFRQEVPSDFNADSHQTRNRLVYPQMKAHLRSDTSLSKRHIWVTANVTGFILDLDSSISDCVFSLIDVYRQGRERMERLAGNIPRGAASSPSEPSSTVTPLTEEYVPPVPGSNIFGALIFESGVVRVHSEGHHMRAMSSAFSDDVDDYLPTTETEVIKLPVVSAWIEYRASAASSPAGGPRTMQPSILIFKSKIHSSHNTLKPILLPFVTEITDYIQMRMRKTSRQNTSSSNPPLTAVSDSIRSLPSATMENLSETSSSLQINFSLRIDQSTLEFTCQPDVNVLAALRWESGGFVVSISPGAHKVTFTGTVDGLTVGLKHGFLSEDCVNLAARNLAFSLAFAKTQDARGNLDSAVSLVISTDISGGVRFSRLQDILCFKAVWLDRIPLITAHHTPPEEPAVVSPTASHLTSPTVKQEVTTAIIIRIRRIEVNVDLGQSISNVTLNMEDALIRTRLSERSSEVSLSVADVAILAKGNISGHITVPDCIFQTIRRNEEVLSQDSSSARLLELTMTSGPLSAELESEHQRLLVYRADPIQVDIHDDWSLISSMVGEKDRPLLLAFTIRGKEITALATIATIPKLMLYVNKFKANIAAQRLGASRESEAFRATQAPRPDNPLTEVASAFFQSARTRFKEAETDISYVIRQQMSFRLEMLRLILFPRSMADTELAQFIGRDVHASLNRTVEDGLPSRREIHLSFNTMNISKFSQLHSVLPSTATVSNDRDWIDSLFKNPTEANIVGLPSMKMLMITEESVQDLTTRLVYDFYSTFQGRGDKSLEDIYITLNVALYSWLTGLRKTLSREMEQVQGSLNAPPGSTPGMSRKKAAAAASPEVASAPEVTQLDVETALTQGISAAAASLSPRTQVAGNMTPIPPNISPTDGVSSPELTRPAKRTTQPQEGESSNTPPMVSGSQSSTTPGKPSLVYEYRERKIQRLTMRQLGEATPDVMHPFFMKKAGFNLEDSLPQYVHEYATIPLEEIMEALLNLYSKQLRTERGTGEGEKS
ncbi:hypothetical protein HYDPIDRAFT_177084 [Hydnomerulius pinastri MD-312]|uniref:Csf1 N-terminal domain-containing protein n=1 Tax=Hydnomerulius pinastri MD-312 TaxID=994086 RepID=A0A0C9W4G0_9AGAM|nr:hypothetical protein HYDPIDRAFT_177084 [Hydnomerulius pinastri MD-312]